MDAYLDIETTGLSFYVHKVTVVGLCLGQSEHVIQWFGERINARRIMEVLERSAVTTIYTYNGSRFDLPFLKNYLGVDLEKRFGHRDLMLDCWQRNLYGGLKVVEKTLGLSRKLKDIDGLEAVRLWHKYERYRDYMALRILLDYNKEDVLSLRALKGILLP